MLFVGSWPYVCGLVGLRLHCVFRGSWVFVEGCYFGVVLVLSFGWYDIDGVGWTGLLCLWVCYLGWCCVRGVGFRLGAVLV